MWPSTRAQAVALAAIRLPVFKEVRTHGARSRESRLRLASRAPLNAAEAWPEGRLLSSLSSGLSRPVASLIRSVAAPVEALGLEDNPRVVGLQFDNHAAARDVAAWLEHDGEWALTGSGADPAAINAQARAQEAAMGQEFRLFMKNFFRLIWGP